LRRLVLRCSKADEPTTSELPRTIIVGTIVELVTRKLDEAANIEL
jgi:hypothetical protein